MVVKNVELRKKLAGLLIMFALAYGQYWLLKREFMDLSFIRIIMIQLKTH